MRVPRLRVGILIADEIFERRLQEGGDRGLLLHGQMLDLSKKGAGRATVMFCVSMGGWLSPRNSV